MEGLLLSIVLGFVPMFFFASWVYWIDRYEKEPKVLLGGMFLWGAVFAAGGAFLINTLLGVATYLFTGSEQLSEIATGSLFAPFVEEILKGFAVFVVFLVFRQEFDSYLDGVVYAAIVALGFAATENAFYIFTYGYAENGMEGIFGMFIVRVLMVGWQHPFYTAFTGIGLAAARLSRRTAVKVMAPLAGLTAAILAHSAHNTIAETVEGAGGLIAATLLDWSGWLVMFVFIVWAIFREKHWIREYLKDEAEKTVITQAQYRAACSTAGRSMACLEAFFSGNYHETKRFYQLTAELAHKKHQLARLGEERGNYRVIEKLREELSQLSAAAKPGIS